MPLTPSSDGSQRSLGVCSLLLILFGSGCASEPQVSEPPAGEWPQFRGPNGQGISPDVDLPERWRPAGENFRWKTRIPGQGNSSPVVSGGRVFVTTAYGEPTDGREALKLKRLLKRVVVAIDLESGKTLWQTPVFEGQVGKIHWLNSHATPTPATDGKTLFVSFDAHLAALDYDGRMLWKKDLGSSYYEHSHYGTASSPIVTSKAVFFFQDREEGKVPKPGWLVALDKKNGDLIWRDEWTDSCCSYATPVVIQRGKREILLVQTSRVANAYDSATGERLWQIQHKNTQPVPSIAVWGDFVTFPGAIHDALLSTFRLGAPEEEPEFLWGTRQTVPDIPSPLYFQGHLFTLDGHGRLLKRNPVSGKAVWRGRLPSSNYRAALVYGDGKFYAVNDGGKTAVIDATAKRFRLIRENRLGEGSRATPAIADGCLIIRGSHHLFCIEKKADAA